MHVRDSGSWDAWRRPDLGRCIRCPYSRHHLPLSQHHRRHEDSLHWRMLPAVGHAGKRRLDLTYAQILKNEQKPAVELCAERDLSSYSRFTRSSVGEFMSLFTKTVAERTKPGQRQDVEEQSYTFHAYGRSEGVAAIIISDQEYPALVAHQLLSKILDEFLSRYPRTAFANSNAELPFPPLKEYIVKYQDPHAADSIMKIQKELDETKIVLHKTIESVLERGEKIDNLVAKSDGLSAQSKMFYTQAKKQNSCCIVM